MKTGGRRCQTFNKADELQTGPRRRSNLEVPGRRPPCDGPHPPHSSPRPSRCIRLPGHPLPGKIGLFPVAIPLRTCSGRRRPQADSLAAGKAHHRRRCSHLAILGPATQKGASASAGGLSNRQLSIKAVAPRAPAIIERLDSILIIKHFHSVSYNLHLSHISRAT